VAWAKSLGDAAPQTATALAVADDGNVVFAGLLQGALDPGCSRACLLMSASGIDPFVAALDRDGEGLWGQLWPATGAASIDSMWAVGGAVWMAGSFSGELSLPTNTHVSGDSDLFVVQTVAADGSLLSDSSVIDAGFQNNAQLAVSVFQDAVLASNVELAGNVDVGVRLLLNATPPRFWNRTFGSMFHDELHALVTDDEGEIVIAGELGSTTSFGCAARLAASEDAFVAKLARNSGDCIWAQAFAGPGRQRITAMAAAPDSHLVIAGTFEQSIVLGERSVAAFQSDSDAFLAELDADGEVLWYLTSNAPGIERPTALSVTADGRIAMAGEFSYSLGFDERMTSDAESDGFVAVFEGPSLRWSAQLKGPGPQRFVAVACREGRVVALGDGSNNAAIGDRTLIAPGGTPNVVLASFVE
jgi:hypothetical protein